jgi:saccharopine dehydrogenase-like NADP-dependent oxidoreductase
MNEILILGAGKIGSSIAKLLSHTAEYKITLADVSSDSLGYIPPLKHVNKVACDVAAMDASVSELFKNKIAVISALPFYQNVHVAELAASVGASYFDLTEDVETTRGIQEIAKKAGKNQIFMPQCGLAPGFIGIVGNDLARKFDSLDTLQMRVGALPLYPSNMLKYNLTWSTDGLINEYCNPCEAIIDGKYVEALPLEGLEHFSVDGVRYEAFNTSGGLGTLCETWKGKVRNLNYKTVRYMGHRELVSFLLFELNLNKRPKLLKKVFERAVPTTNQDVVIIFCSAYGKKDGKLVQITDARKVYHDEVYGEEWSAIQITTAAGICAVLDLHMQGKLPSSGFVSQEEVKLSDFLANRFGDYFNANKKHQNVKPVEVFLGEN